MRFAMRPRPRKILLISNRGNCDGVISAEENKEENANDDNPKPSDFEHIPGFKNSMANKSGDVNKVNLFKRHKKADTSKTHFTVANLIFLKKAIRKLKGEGEYQIKFPSVDWAEEDIEIEIHCDAGQILT